MEVEIKLICRDLSGLRKELLKMRAVLVKTKHQVDIYYDHPARVLVKKSEYLRIRRTKGKKVLAHHINLADGVNDECEIEMEEEVKIEGLLKRLGFPQLGTIDKKREQYRLNGFNICLDEVKDIGNFVEIELMARKGGEARAKEKCWQMARKLGFSKKDKFDYWLCDIAVGKVKRNLNVG